MAPPSKNLAWRFRAWDVSAFRVYKIYKDSGFEMARVYGLVFLGLSVRGEGCGDGSEFEVYVYQVSDLGFGFLKLRGSKVQGFKGAESTAGSRYTFMGFRVSDLG